MSVVEGFAGMRIRNNHISFNPFLPEKWNQFSFSIRFRGAILNVKVEKETIHIQNTSDKEVDVLVQSTSNVRVFANAIKKYKINGMKGIDENPPIPAQDKLMETYRRFAKGARNL